MTTSKKKATRLVYFFEENKQRLSNDYGILKMRD